MEIVIGVVLALLAFWLCWRYQNNMISALKFAVMFGISVVFGGAVYVAVSFFGGAFLVGFAVASIVWGAVWYVSLRSKNTEDKMLILMGILRDIRKNPSATGTKSPDDKAESHISQENQDENPGDDDLPDIEEIAETVKDIGKRAARGIFRRVTKGSNRHNN